jgi:hypothetical protein
MDACCYYNPSVYSIRLCLNISPTNESCTNRCEKLSSTGCACYVRSSCDSPQALLCAMLIACPSALPSAPRPVEQAPALNTLLCNALPIASILGILPVGSHAGFGRTISMICIASSDRVSSSKEDRDRYVRSWSGLMGHRVKRKYSTPSMASPTKWCVGKRATFASITKLKYPCETYYSQATAKASVLGAKKSRVWPVFRR